MVISEILAFLKERDAHLIRNGRLSNTFNATAMGFVFGYAGGYELFGPQVLGATILWLAIIPFVLSVATEKDKTAICTIWL